MTLEPDDPTVETREGFTVAGVGARDETVDPAALWAALPEFDDALARVAASDERYGVLVAEEATRELTYVAGVAVRSVDELPRELTVVEVPAGEYAAFPLAGASVHDPLTEARASWLPEMAYEPPDVPAFERYDADVDPTDADAPRSFHVPVEVR